MESILQSTLAIAGGVLLVRTIPYGTWAPLDRSRAWTTRLSLLGAVIAATLAWLHLPNATTTLPEVLFVGSSIHLFASRLCLEFIRGLASGRANVFELMIVVALTHLALPAVAIPQSWWIVLAPLTMDSLLSTVSLASHTKRYGVPEGSTHDWVHFVVIHPELVLSPIPLGTSIASYGVKAGLRSCAIGVAFVMLASAISTISRSPYWPLQMGSRASIPTIVVLVLYHLGTASVREGLSAWLGRPVIRGYDAIWKARDPVDFWHRWNRWYQCWIDHQVFRPAIRSRALRSVPRVLRSFVATATAFGMSGLIHVGSSNLFNSSMTTIDFDFRYASVFFWCFVQYESFQLLRMRFAPFRGAIGAIVTVVFWASMLLIIHVSKIGS